MAQSRKRSPGVRCGWQGGGTALRRRACWDCPLRAKSARLCARSPAVSLAKRERQDGHRLRIKDWAGGAGAIPAKWDASPRIRRRGRSRRRPCPFSHHRRARAKAGLAGATVLRGPASFGLSRHVNGELAVEAPRNPPMVVEIVDTAERIHAFLPQLDQLIGSGLVTLEQVHMFRCGRAARENISSFVIGETPGNIEEGGHGRGRTS